MLGILEKNQNFGGSHFAMTSPFHCTVYAFFAGDRTKFTSSITQTKNPAQSISHTSPMHRLMILAAFCLQFASTIPIPIKPDCPDLCAGAYPYETGCHWGCQIAMENPISGSTIWVGTTLKSNTHNAIACLAGCEAVSEYSAWVRERGQTQTQLP